MAFGWHDCHLFQFSPGGYGSSPCICMPQPDFDFDDSSKNLNASKLKLEKIFITEKQKFTYIYDFGDDWEHSITFEKRIEGEAKSAVCIAGKGACPPEDCGGLYGYLQFKETMANPKHPEYKEMKEWMGLEPDEEWNATSFDLEESSKQVKTIK